MNDNEIYSFEDRVYAQPSLSSGEQEKFISNLRDLQNKNNAQIAQQTQSLGTDVPSNLGGLGGGEAYFTSRYQTPQVGEMVDTLKTAAKSQELQDVMTNYQSQLNNRYKQAYRAYQERERKRKKALEDAQLASLKGNGGGNGGGGGDGNEGDTLDISTNAPQTGGFWDTKIGKATSDWINKVVQGGVVDYNTTGNVAGKGTDAAFNMAIGGGGADLGVWPNGQKMTEGSTYSFGGKTYRVTYKSGNRQFEVL